MKLADASLLVYAVNERAPEHDICRKWLEEALNSEETLGFAWVVLIAFLRLTTRAPIVPKPLPTAKALDLVETWLNQPCATIVHPGPSHFGAPKREAAQIASEVPMTAAKIAARVA